MVEVAQTIEQQRALALAKARRRRMEAEATPTAPTTPPAKGYEGAGSRTSLLGSLYDALGTALSGGGPDLPPNEKPKDAIDVVQDASANVVRGVPELVSAVTSIPSLAMGAMNPTNVPQKVEQGVSTIKSTVGPPTTVGKGYIEQIVGMLPDRIQESVRKHIGDVGPDPESQEWIDAQKAAGANLVGTELANVLSHPSVKSAIKKVTGLGAPKPIDLTPNRAQINKLSTIAQYSPGTKNIAPQEIAIPTQDLLRQGLQEFGIKPEQISIKETSLPTDLNGDLYRGLNAVDHAQLAKVLGKTSAQTHPLAIELGDHIVDIAHRPIAEAINSIADEYLPAAARKGIEDTISKYINSLDKTDPLRTALEKRLEEVKAADGTYRGYDRIKIRGNKMTSRLYGKNPSAANAATAAPVFSFQIVNDAIREFMYPSVEVTAQLPKDTIINAGRLESKAIHMRDGMRSAWVESAGKQASAAATKFEQFKHAFAGDGGLIPATAKSYGIGVIRRLVNSKTPLIDFNTALREGIGAVDQTKLNTSGTQVAKPKFTPRPAKPSPYDQFKNPSGAAPASLPSVNQPVGAPDQFKNPSGVSAGTGGPN